MKNTNNFRDCQKKEGKYSVETGDLTPDSVESFLLNNEDDSAE